MSTIMQRYKNLLIEVNQKINLVSRRCTADDIDKHIEDALMALEFYKLDGKRVIDVGSGGGLPGIPLAIACPDAGFTLLESDLKKSQFLVTAVQELGLNNVEIIRERAEVVGQEPVYRESFDLAVSRAVAELNTLLEYALPLVKVKGVFIAWKGKKSFTELEKARSALEVLGGQLEDISEYSLGEAQRYLLGFRKVNPSPEKYPRRVGIPGKRPL